MNDDTLVPRTPIRLRTFLLPIAYAILVIAIAAARAIASTAEDGPPALALAEGVILLFITVGPAFVAAHLEAKRRPLAELDRRLQTARKHLAREEREIAKAEAYLLAVDQDQMNWERQGFERRATYAASFEVAHAEAAQVDDETPSDDVRLNEPINNTRNRRGQS